MRVPAAILVSFLSVIAAQAQDKAPQVSIELSDTQTIVGQPLTLRLKILVPTWMTKPPILPTFEVPSLLVRLPPRSSTPITERIDGETWSGISQSYRLYPLAHGQFEILAQNLVLTYADPDTVQPVEVEIPLDGFGFDSAIPVEARGVNPLILARAFTVTQDLDFGDTLEAGDAVTRRLSATITGTTAILIPPLIPIIENGTLRAYANEPVVTETDDRGGISGSRVESVTYIAQYGGTVELPPIRLSWFNIESEDIETESFEGVTLTILGKGPEKSEHSSYFYVWVSAGIISFSVCCLIAWRLVWPSVAVSLDRRRQIWRASERYASRQVQMALHNNNLNMALTAIEHWLTFYPSAELALKQKLAHTVTGIGAARFAKSAKSDDPQVWDQAKHTFKECRARLRAKPGSAPGLPPLNP